MAAGVKLLELRREELATRQTAWIIVREGDEECIKVSWDSLLDQEEIEHKISPFWKINIQMADMIHTLELLYTD